MENNNIIEKDTLNIMVDKIFILEKLVNKGLLPKEKEWLTLLMVPLLTDAQILTEKCLELKERNFDDYTVRNFYEQYPKYIRLLDYEDRVKILYANLQKSKSFFFDLIKQTDSFCPKMVYDIIGVLNPCEIAASLDCDKSIYTKDDLSYMKKISEFIKNMPYVWNVQNKKNFLGKSKDLAFCPCGKSFDIDTDFCPGCGKNSKGFKSIEDKIIKRFDYKIVCLDSFFSE